MLKKRELQKEGEISQSQVKAYFISEAVFMESTFI